MSRHSSWPGSCGVVHCRYNPGDGDEHGMGRGSEERRESVMINGDGPAKRRNNRTGAAHKRNISKADEVDRGGNGTHQQGLTDLTQV